MKYNGVVIKKFIKIQSVIRMHLWVVFYLKKNVFPKIKKLYNKKKKEYVHEYSVFGDNSNESIKLQEIAFTQKQKKMKEGFLAQILIGNWIGWENLKRGHSSGLDCRKKDNTIILELKNKYNTIKGSEIKKSLLPTLVEYKKKNPLTRCIWAIVNPKPKKKNLIETIKFNGFEIEKIQGKELFNLVFSIGNINYSKKVINITKKFIKNF